MSVTDIESGMLLIGFFTLPPAAQRFSLPVKSKGSQHCHIRCNKLLYKCFGFKEYFGLNMEVHLFPLQSYKVSLLIYWRNAG